MSKLSLASSLADEFGVSFARASKFVDDVGAGSARSSLNNAASYGSRNVKLALGGGAVAGGGALAWRQQDVSTARSIAQQQQSYSETVASIMESDLPPEVKRQLVEEAGKNAGSSSGGSGGGGGGDGGDGGGGSGLLPDNPQVLIILLIVLVFGMKFALDGDD